MLSHWNIWLDALWRDIRYAVRVLWRSPRFTVTALTLLVFGIGATTAILTITYSVLVRPLPYPNAERLVFLAEKNGPGIAWPNFEDWRKRARSFDGLACSLADAILMTSGEIPRRFESRSVSSNFFHVLGVSPFRGRLFDDTDARPNSPATVLISHTFWMQELGGDPAMIGRSILLNGSPFLVIGVLPPSFRYMTPADVYLLIEPQVAANYRGMLSRNTHTSLYAVGRLKAGVSVTAARTEMQSIAAALALEYSSKSSKSAGVQLVPLIDRIVGGMAQTLTVLAGAVTLLLLITCVNLAGLLLNRGYSRVHEFGMRAALGASRWSLVGQLLIEQLLLVVTGGALGAVVGVAILTGLVSAAPRDLPRLDEIHLDLAVLSWTTLLSCGCAFAFGLLPVLKTSRVNSQELVIRASRSSTHSAFSLRWGLMIAEVAIAMVLLSGSGLMVHTMLRLARVDPGFDPHNLQTFMFSLPGPSWPDARKQVFYDAVVEHLRAVPGVENAAVTYSLPILGSNWWNVFMIAGTTPGFWESVGELPNAGMVPVTAGYFETLKIPLIRGRYFDRSDRSNSLAVAIVNNSVAKKYWPDEDPIGKQIRQGFPPDPYGPWRTIVGVVGDIKQNGVDQEMPRQIYMPIVQQPRTTVFAIVHTRRGPLSNSSIEAAIHDLDRTVPIFNDRTLDQVMSEASSRRRIAMVVLSFFGGMAFLLAVIGLYGLIAQRVVERRREIGVRMAVGATGTQVVRLFLRHGLVVVAVGIGCGIVAAMAAARSLASLVFGISVTDPATLGTVAALLMVVTLLACYMPARSATRVDPSEVLRSE